jgi:translation elongation factor EF-Tu-like GTPase
MNRKSIVEPPRLEVEVVFIMAEVGGRSLAPQHLSSGRYRPHLRVAGVGEFLGVAFVDGPALVEAGQQVRATVSLIYGVDYSPLKAGTLFSVVEGPHFVAFGVVVGSTPSA